MKSSSMPGTIMVQDLDEFNSILEVLFEASVCNLINLQPGWAPSVHRAIGFVDHIELWSIKIIIMDIFLKKEVL